LSTKNISNSEIGITANFLKKIIGNYCLLTF
jgi:hypothetical protein